MTVTPPVPVSVGTRGSILVDTWRLLKEHSKDVIQIVIIFAALSGALQYALPTIDVPTPVTTSCEESENEATCRSEHREEIKAEATAVIEAGLEKAGSYITVFLLMMLAQSFGMYATMVKMVNVAMGKNLILSGSAFFRYILITFWIFLRPLLWNVIPLLGQIMFIRSVTRYSLAGVCVLLEEKPEMQTSWAITEGHVWRLIGVWFCLVFAMILFLIPAGVLLGFIVMSGEDALGAGLQVFASQVFSLLILPALYVAMYRILTAEAAAKETLS